MTPGWLYSPTRLGLVVLGLSGPSPQEKPRGARLARELSHPFSLVDALDSRWLHQHGGERASSPERVEASIATR